VSKEDLKVRERCLAIWVALGFITWEHITWLRPWVFPFRGSRRLWRAVSRAFKQAV